MIVYEDRWYQSNALRALYDYFETHETGNPLIAMPTGTGKSLVIAKFCKEVLTKYPGQRILMLTHVKELIQQNGSKVIDIWPNAPLGVYSAGLGQRDTALPLIFAGVQSVDNMIKRGGNLLGHRDLVIIDEAHLVGDSESSQYLNVLTALWETNNNIRIIGLSGTIYRMKMGLLTNGDIFTDVCYDITDYKSFNRLVDDGYMCPLVTKQTASEIDVSKVKVLTNDYNQKQLEKESEKITYNACKEIVEYGIGQNRKSWLIFATSIEHAEHITACLQSFGINAAASHSKLDPNLNDQIIADFKSGELQALVNMNKYTTGFDHPGIDLIGMLRATMSPGLWVQMLGRGARPCIGKNNCLVLDFAGNTKRLGPINDVNIPGQKKEGTGEAPIKLCENCQSLIHASLRVCPNCGQEFEFKSKLKNTADTMAVMKNDNPVIEWLAVQKTVYREHLKKGSPPILKVTYFCGLKMYSEYVCIEHIGYAKKRAHEWWERRHETECPQTTKDALEITSQLRCPKQIKIRLDTKYPEILGVEF